MEIRRLKPEETGLLKQGISELAAYHNATSTYFSGIYPSQPVERVAETFAEEIRSGTAVIEAVFEAEKLVAFCKFNRNGAHGDLDYLFVDADCRKSGYGRLLMERAMNYFNRHGVEEIDIKVVVGNDASGFYEKFGFRPKMVVYSKRCRKCNDMPDYVLKRQLQNIGK